MELNKCIIINAAWKYWYPTGQKRLVNSLVHHGCAANIKTWTNDPISDIFDEECPYTIKAAAMQWVLDQKKYTHVLWLDCSVWAIRNPNSFFDIINNDGYYFFRTGYNLAQSANDQALSYFGVNRDKAEQMHELASGVFGLNLEREEGMEFAKGFIEAAKDGVFHGSRLHDKQSEDPRFLFHRQDQTAASFLFHKLNFDKMHVLGEHVDYQQDGKKPNDSTCFLIRGL